MKNSFPKQCAAVCKFLLLWNLLSLEYTQKYVWVIACSVMRMWCSMFMSTENSGGVCSLPACNKLWRCKPCYTARAAPHRSSEEHEHCTFTPGDIPESPWQESPVSLLRLFCFKCDPSMVSCLASANWTLQDVKCKATASRQKTRKSDSKTCPCDSTGVLLSPHPDAFWKWQNFLITRKTKALLRALMNSSHDAGTVMLAVKVWTASVSQH